MQKTRQYCLQIYKEELSSSLLVKLAPPYSCYKHNIFLAIVFIHTNSECKTLSPIQLKHGRENSKLHAVGKYLYKILKEASNTACSSLLGPYIVSSTRYCSGSSVHRLMFWYKLLKLWNQSLQVHWDGV